MSDEVQVALLKKIASGVGWGCSFWLFLICMNTCGLAGDIARRLGK